MTTLLNREPNYQPSRCSSASSPTRIIGPGESIVLPREAEHVDAEAELAIVIGKRARRVCADDALAVVAGYTCANDVSARNLQFRDGQWL